MIKPDLSINLLGIKIDNPIIPASGTFGYGYEFKQWYDINILGTFSTKGTTLLPRFGNKTPRIAETPRGILNAVGLQNPGIDAVVKEELPRLKSFFKKKVMINIAGFTTDDFVKSVKKIANHEMIGWIELNVSCPNVCKGGAAIGSDKNATAEVVKAVRKLTKKPLIVKLSPSVSNIVEVAKAAEAAGANGLTIGNTLLGLRMNLHTRKPLLNNVTGGFSGPAIFPVAIRCVYQVSHAVKIPVIGCGGVSSAEDVIEMMMAGATAVQVGAANLVDPHICKKIIEDLPRVMKKYNIKSLKEISGGTD